MSQGPHNGAKILGPDFIPSSLETKAEPAEVPMPLAAVKVVMAPVLEVIVPSIVDPHGPPLFHFKFWADGKTEGLNFDTGDRPIIVNRMPQLLANLLDPMRGFVQEADDAITELVGDPEQRSAIEAIAAHVFETGNMP